MKKILISFCLLEVFLAVPPAVEAEDILLFKFPSFGQSHCRAQAALDSLALPYTVGTPSTFNSLLQGDTWDMVVVDCPSTRPFSGTWTPLTDYINNGGRVVMSFWGLDGAPSLADAFGVSVTSSFNNPENVYRWDVSHPVFNIPNLVANLTSWQDTANDDGDKLALVPLSGAQALGGFTISPTAGQAAIVLGNNGRTIYNGFLFEELNDPVGTKLVANEIMYVIPEPATIMLLGLGSLGLLRKRRA